VTSDIAFDDATLVSVGKKNCYWKTTLYNS